MVKWVVCVLGLFEFEWGSVGGGVFCFVVVDLFLVVWGEVVFLFLVIELVLLLFVELLFVLFV